MKILTIDTETFYDKKDYSLSKQTTESYIRDPRFQVIGVSVKVDDAPAIWFSGTRKETRDFLLSFNPNKCLCLSHNAHFDMAIMLWHFGIRPKGFLDTLSMANALHGINKSVSLKSLSEQYGLPPKGTEVDDASGKRREDFSAAELTAYGEYCKNDTELCRALFDLMAPAFSRAELKLIDLTVRMFVEPVLQLDLPILEKHLIAVRRAQQESLLKLSDMLSVPQEELKTILMSNPKFATLLRKLKVDPPTKISVTTGKETHAFAKTDEAFAALLEHDDPLVQAAVAARLGNKTTIEESRTEAFIGIAQRGTFPFPLKYSGAAVTHRWSGFDVNVQNMPRGGELRKAIRAPKGFKIVAADLSNIELRLGLYMACQDDKLQLIDDGVDLYVDVAVPVFNKSYGEIVDLGKKSRERVTGKVISLSCIAEGELVLTPRGLVPIEKILLDDLVWDGIEWVYHEGVIYQGERDVITYQGLTATADHKVWTEAGRNISFGESQSSIHTLATTGNGRAAVRFLGGSKPFHAAERQTHRRTSPLRLWAARMAQLGQHAAGTINPMPYMLYALSTGAARIFSGGYQSEKATTETRGGNFSAVQQYQRSGVCELRGPRNTSAVPYSEITRGVHTQTTSTGELRRGTDRSKEQRQALPEGKLARCVSSNQYAKPAAHDLCLLERAKGTYQRLVFALWSYSDKTLRAARTYWQRHSSTSAKSGSGEAQKLAENKRTVRVYDIVNAGPRHRFTVSNILVSNCVYGTGAAKLKDTLRVQGKVRFSLEETQAMTDLYRSTYAMVVAAWAQGKEVLDCLYQKGCMDFLRPGILQVTPQGIIKPSGLILTYPDLRWTKDKTDGKMGYTYEQKRKARDRVYGSKCFQRCVQSLARDIIAEQMLQIDKRFHVVGTVHDEVICVVANEEVEEAQEYMLECMRTSPSWAEGLPLDAEIGVGDSYGESH